MKVNEVTSLGEHRALTEHDCSLWSPRELLVALLRDLDKGEFTPTGLVVCYFTRRDDGFVVNGMQRSRATTMETVAMIEMAKHDLLEQEL